MPSAVRKKSSSNLLRHFSRHKADTDLLDTNEETESERPGHQRYATSPGGSAGLQSRRHLSFFGRERPPTSDAEEHSQSLDYFALSPSRVTAFVPIADSPKTILPRSSPDHMQMPFPQIADHGEAPVSLPSHSQSSPYSLEDSSGITAEFDNAAHSMHADPRSYIDSPNDNQAATTLEPEPNAEIQSDAASGAATGSSPAPLPDDDILQPVVIEKVEGIEKMIEKKSLETKLASKKDDEFDAEYSVVEGAAPDGQSFAEDIAQTIENGLNIFQEQCPVLLDALEEIGKLHPALGAVVLAFRAAYHMWKNNRDNDKRVVMLYVSMMDMMAVLRSVPRSSSNAGVWTLLSQHCIAAESSIKDCANVCDLYLKKSSLIRVLKGPIWQAELIQWITKFGEHKQNFLIALSLFTSNAAQDTQATLSAVGLRVADISDKLTMLITRLTPTNEVELTTKINEKGGTQAILRNEAYLHELFDAQAGTRGSASTVGSAVGIAVGHSDGTALQPGDKTKNSENPSKSEKPKASSDYDFQNFKEEISEELKAAVEKNLLTFEGKYILEQDRLKNFISDANNQLLAAVTAGPHELVNNEALRTLWKDMIWRRNVKSRFFVMTLRDNLNDIVKRTQAKTESEEAQAKTESAEANTGTDEVHDSLQTDDWAFEYISIAYLQPIMEAFDDDGSGYTTVFEVNRFVDSLPPRLNWSLPHWIAYWAIGWELVSAEYCKKILEIFAHMFKMRANVLPENRSVVDNYLNEVWETGAKLVTPMATRNRDDTVHLVETKFCGFLEYEEERIKRNLQKVKFDIDALDTVYIVAGPERIDNTRVRIEKHVYPLLYLLLRRDLTILDIAKTKVLHKDELPDSASSAKWVYYAVSLRFQHLKVRFTQQKMDVDKQMKTVASGMFEYYSDPGTLFNMSNFATRSYDPPQTSEAPTLEYKEHREILNYPVQDRYRTRRLKYPSEHDLDDTLEGARNDEAVVSTDLGDSSNTINAAKTLNNLQRRRIAYECLPELPTEADRQASWAIKALLGPWNGFVYNRVFYPDSYMRSFYFHACTEEDANVEALGFYNGIQFTLRGQCDMDGDGILSVMFCTQYSEGYWNEYFFGHVLPDGSLRTPAELVRHRPRPEEFALDKPKALWKYAWQAIRAQVSRKTKPKEYFANRRAALERLDALRIRFTNYGCGLDDPELKEFTFRMQMLTACDINLRRLKLDWQLKLMPGHQTYACNSCGERLGGARLICLDCQAPSLSCWQTVDLCDVPRCYTSTLKLERFDKPHTPEHDILKVRTVLQYRDLPELDRKAKVALEACRNIWEEAHFVEEPGLSHPTEGEDADDGNIAYSEGTVDASDFGNRLDGDVKVNSAATEDTPVAAQIACGICLQTVDQPCWFCVDCYHGEIKLFICNECEQKTRLRCTSCRSLFKQCSWYYGSFPDENFMCNTCNSRKEKKDPPTPTQKHTYIHALVRCQPKAGLVEEKTITMEEKVIALDAKIETLSSAFEEKVSLLDDRVSRVEDSLARVESKLDLLFSYLVNNQV